MSDMTDKSFYQRHSFNILKLLPTVSGIAHIMTREKKITKDGTAAILLYIFMQSSAVYSQCEAVLFNKLPGYHVISPVLRTVPCPGDACSLTLCAVSCMASPCVAVSFNVVDKICHQHEKPIYSPEVTYEKSPDWEYLNLKTDYLFYNDWILVFRATRYINQSAYDTWLNVGRYDDFPLLRHNVPIGCLTTNGSHYCDRHFKSKLIDMWDSANIEEVKLVLFENGVPMEHITFNAVGATSTTWFTESRMTSSSWTDMMGNTFNFFSQEGEEWIFRRWYVSHVHKGCPDDLGWMVVLENTVITCEWEYPANRGYPVFLYARNHQKTQWDKDGFGEADVMAVFVKLAH